MPTCRHCYVRGCDDGQLIYVNPQTLKVMRYPCNHKCHKEAS